MKKRAMGVLAGAVLGAIGSAQAAPFSVGDLAVYRVGTGGAALSSAATAVFVDEYTTTGTLVQSIALPTAVSGSNNPLVASGTATSEGLMTLSTDGKSLVLTGYGAAPGTTGIAGTATTAVPRVIGTIDGNGNINTSTTTTAFSGNNIRSAVTSDGTTLFAAGATGGVITTTLGGSGAGTVVSSTVANLRQLEIFNSQLYVSTGSGSAVRVGTVGTGVSTATAQTITNLTGLPITSGSSTSPVNSPYTYFFATLNPADTSPDTLYVADDFGGAAGVGDIEKFSLVSGNWTLNNIVAAQDVRGLMGVVSGTSVTLYATTGNAIYSLTDGSGFNASIDGTVSTLVSAPTNEAFRGITFAPTAVPEPVGLSLLGLGGMILLGRRRKV